MPVGTRFSHAPNREPVHALGLVVCDACYLVQLKEKMSLDDDYQNLLSECALNAQAVGAETDATNIARVRQLVYIGGLSGNVPNLPRLGEVDFLDFGLLVGKVVSKETVFASLDDLFEAAVRLLLSKHRPFEEVIIDNSIPEAHPLHISNVENVESYLRNVSQLIKDDGILSVRCPDADAILSLGHVNYIYHEHKAYFSSMSLTNLLAGAGFKFISRTHSEDGINSIFKFRKKKSLADRIANRLRPSLTELVSPWHELEEKIQVRRSELRAICREAVNGKIAGYGASVAGMASLFHFGLEDQIDLMFDDAPERGGLYCPRINHQVLSGEEISSHNIGRTFVLTPRFLKAIADTRGDNLGEIISVGQV